jgi:hypothetical protein
MNTETAENIAPGINGIDGTVHRVAQKAHEAVDRLEQTLGASTDKVLTLQEEYGAVARDKIVASPLAAVAAAFGAGVIFSKLFLR